MFAQSADNVILALKITLYKISRIALFSQICSIVHKKTCGTNNMSTAKPNQNRQTNNTHHNTSHKKMACCPRWSAALKRDFSNKIKSRHINPKRTNKKYILSIRDNYYKGRSDTTFISNFNTSVAEWRGGFYVNEYYKTKKCEFSVSWPYLIIFTVTKLFLLFNCSL